MTSRQNGESLSKRNKLNKKNDFILLRKLYLFVLKNKFFCLKIIQNVTRIISIVT